MKIFRRLFSCRFTSKPFIACYLLFNLIFSVCFGGDEYRVFTSNDGLTLEAQVVSCVVDVHVTLQRSDGRLFKEVSWSRFSHDDHRYFKDWVKAEEAKVNQADLTEDARIEVTVLKGIDDDFNSYGDIDDRVIDFEPAVIIKSDELYRTFTGVNGVVVFIGEAYLNKKEHVVLARQQFTLDLPPEETIRWTANPFTCRYDPDFGARSVRHGVY